MNCYALIRLLESFENMTSQTSLINLDVGGRVSENAWPFYIDGGEARDSRMLYVLLGVLGESPQVLEPLPWRVVLVHPSTCNPLWPCLTLP